MAGRWSTVLSEPPMAMFTRSMFSRADSVMIFEGVRPCSSNLITATPASTARRSFFAVVACAVPSPGSDMPTASVRQAMVLAVPIPEQAPAQG